jgi:phosphoglycolate phosphatase
VHAARVNHYPATLVFDLDGTLVDTAPDLCAALNHALGVLGRPPVPADAVRHMVGHGARALLARGLASSGEASAEMIEAGVPAFMAYYHAHIADHSRPFEGVEAALSALAAAGCRLAICTNKPVALADALVAALGWTDRFDAVLGYDSVARPKPDAEHVLATLRACGGTVGDAVFIGDSITDVTAARAAGLPVVVVSFGFSDRPVVELDADAVIDHYADLLPLLSRLKADAA